MRLFTVMLESMGGIILRTSLFDLDVPVSVYPALDILSLRFCPCGYNRDRIRVQQLDFLVSNYCGFRLCGVDVLVLHLYTLIHNVHIYGFVFLGL